MCTHMETRVCTQHSCPWLCRELPSAGGQEPSQSRRPAAEPDTGYGHSYMYKPHGHVRGTPLAPARAAARAWRRPVAVWQWEDLSQGQCAAGVDAPYHPAAR